MMLKTYLAAALCITCNPGLAHDVDTGGEGNLLRGVTVPQYAFAGGQATLSCSYDLKAKRLYSLKWYHNNTEFYRYVPTERETPMSDQATPKFTVNELFRDDKRVTLSLTRLSVSASGQYRCEVIAEHPSFRTEWHKATMTVLRQPLSAPVLVGAREVYEPSELIKIGCQPDNHFHGDHKPSLQWFLQGNEVAEAGGSIQVECRLTLGPHQLATNKTIRVRLRVLVDDPLASGSQEAVVNASHCCSLLPCLSMLTPRCADHADDDYDEALGNHLESRVMGVCLNGLNFSPCFFFLFFVFPFFSLFFSFLLVFSSSLFFPSFSLPLHSPSTVPPQSLHIPSTVPPQSLHITSSSLHSPSTLPPPSLHIPPQSLHFPPQSLHFPPQSLHSPSTVPPQSLHLPPYNIRRPATAPPQHRHSHSTATAQHTAQPQLATVSHRTNCRRRESLPKQVKDRRNNALGKTRFDTLTAKWYGRTSSEVPQYFIKGVAKVTRYLTPSAGVSLTSFVTSKECRPLESRQAPVIGHHCLSEDLLAPGPPFVTRASPSVSVAVTRTTSTTITVLPAPYASSAPLPLPPATPCRRHTTHTSTTTPHPCQDTKNPAMNSKALLTPLLLPCTPVKTLKPLPEL
ncbi:uncharacterized protein LOC123509801 [Portunus trituberculatus]|uniref:uncharacterized protein LOC123509801 n=1 Tax=Portunus trituberculatus TaxID=210409 RepID=UPI001E1CBC53|nr:uncharacterized protein LOC123509801 [Portunus trituberculatus]